MQREIFYRSHIRTPKPLQFGFSPQFYHTFKIKLCNKSFSTVCSDKPCRLNWGTCVTESSVLFLLNEKTEIRENTIQPELLHAHFSPPVPITSAWPSHRGWKQSEMLVLSRKTPSMRMALALLFSSTPLCPGSSLSLEMLQSGWLSWARMVWISVLIPLFYPCPPDLFKGLDSCSEQGIINYGVSMTTLEDVFLRLEGEYTDNQKGTICIPQPEISSSAETSKGAS